MIEIGHIFFIFAFVFSLIQIMCSCMSVYTNDKEYLKYSYFINGFVLLSLLMSFLILIYGFVNDDFSIRLVYDNSHSLMPYIYKVFAIWGNHEGSMFLWCFMLSITGLFLWLWVDKNNKDNDFKSYVMLIQGIVFALFIAFSLFTSNPFERLDNIPLQGSDLNPLLQDIGLVLHPPFLYVGYVGVSVIYILTLAGLLNNKVDKSLNQLIRPWALISWAFLSAGIGLGSWWAYYELGWGGFWFWDPVENVSLMPWLIVGALLHTIILQQNNNKFQNWVVVLSISAFGFSLFGTFLVRSGILNSVHSFASDSMRGIYLISIFSILIIGGYIIYTIKHRAIVGGKYKNHLLSNIVVLKILIILTSVFVVFIGTIYPLIIEILTNNKISVGTTYFSLTFIPLVTFLLFIMGYYSILNMKNLINYVFVPLIILSVFMWWLFDVKTFVATLGVVLSLWVCITTIKDFKFKLKTKSIWGLGGVISHMGVGLVALGVTGATTLSQDYLTDLKVGQTKQIGDMAITLNDINTLTKGNYNVLIGEVEITTNNNTYLFYPEKRNFVHRNMVTIETSIKTTILYDLFVALGNIDGENITIRIYKKSMMIWMWVGVLMMFVGGFVNGLYRLRKK